MAKLPDDNSIRSKIFEHWHGTNDGGNRSHLGASVIGKKCKRELFYIFRWAMKSNFPGRILRLFRRGHEEEPYFVDDLKSIGCDVRETDENGGQWQFEMGGGHFGGSADGIIVCGVPEAPKSPHIAEFKTHSDKSFKDLVKKGVEESKYQHFVQMQMYMGMSGLKWGVKHRIERALYGAVNKNDDDLYYERVKYDKKVFNEHCDKSNGIIFSSETPEGISSNPSWYECKFCDYYLLCHGDHVPEVNCRTCCFSTAKPDGTWVCDKIGKVLTEHVQRIGCSDHLINPTMVDTWLIAIDASDDSIKFERKSNQETFIVGKGGMDSHEFKERNEI